MVRQALAIVVALAALSPAAGRAVYAQAALQEKLKTPEALTEQAPAVFRARFDTSQGPRTLAELFEGRHQLVVQHFMLGPGWEQG